MKYIQNYDNFNMKIEVGELKEVLTSEPAQNYEIEPEVEYEDDFEFEL